jgi:DNA polymerase bacteriophage-type
MPVLFRDIETRSTLNLAEVGAWRYADDPTTEVLCAAYAVDDGAVEIWVPGEPVPQVCFTAADDTDWSIIAHNDVFERAIESMLLKPRYGWPITPIDRHRCTLATALANALPGSLDAAAAALGLPYRKDKDGHRLMMAMSKPRKPRKGEDPNTVHWHDDLERRLRLQTYCKADVEVERALYNALPPLVGGRASGLGIGRRYQQPWFPRRS